MSRPRSEPALDGHLCFSLYGAALAINRAYKPVLDELGITYPQYLVLSALWERDGRAVGEIAERLALESSTITPLVKRLESAGFVERRRNRENERQVLVTLTPDGNAMRERSACLGDALFKSSGFSDDEVRRLNGEVRRFRDAVAASLVRTE